MNGASAIGMMAFDLANDRAIPPEAARWR